uniref:Hemagglutinin-neuraminidase n=2 Tax=Macrostomum lignano TaxID=282301 RepID=A0A1I8HYV6_9PLAT
SNDDDLAGVLARIGGELSNYEIRRWYPRLIRSGRRPKDCDGLGVYPMPEREVCVPQLTGPLGACNLYTAFGYLVGDPCVLVKPGAALAGNYTEDLLLSCRAGLIDTRGGAGGEELELKYHPRVAHHGQMYGYFPRFYFPYPSDESFYLPPMVMVQVVRPPRGRSFVLNCSLANSALANDSTQSSLQFLFD